MKLSEALYKGLTNLGESLRKINKDKQDFELESINLGLVSDDVRLRILKQELFRNARAGKDTKELREAIKLLLSSENINSISVTKMNSSVIYFWVNTLMLSSLALLSIVGFTQISINCIGTKSTFCNQVRQVNVYFYGEAEQ